MRKFVIVIDGEKDIEKQYNDYTTDGILRVINNHLRFLRKPYEIFETFASKMNDKDFTVGIDHKPSAQEHIRAIRTVAGITVQQMAKRTGINIHSFYHYETGRMKLTTKIIEQIEEAVDSIIEERLTVAEIKKAS